MLDKSVASSTECLRRVSVTDIATKMLYGKKKINLKGTMNFIEAKWTVSGSRWFRCDLSWDLGARGPQFWYRNSGKP
jgi:hypothetical protein